MTRHPSTSRSSYGFYALSRFDDVVTAHRDWQGFSSSHGVDLASLSTDPEMLRHRRMIIMMDPPEHDVLRALVSRVFTPRAMTAVEPMVREVIVSFLSTLEDRDEFDVVAEFSAPFPMEIIARMLGVPKADRQQLREWQDRSLHRDPGSMYPDHDGIEAMIEVDRLLHGLGGREAPESGRRHAQSPDAGDDST